MIKQNLQEDLIQAMKSKDTDTLQTLRYILSQIKNIEIDKKMELAEEEIVNVFRKEIKKLQDSIDQFQKAAREDLVKEYQKQKDILSSYLPQEMPDEELQQEIMKVAEANKNIFDSNRNAFIGVCIKELKSKADPSRISAIIRALQ